METRAPRAPRKSSATDDDMFRARKAFLAVSTLLIAAAPLTAHAGAAYEEVWYPDGTIRWFNLNVTNAGSGSANIVDAMDYLEAHSPLDIAMTTQSAANLTFKKNGILACGSGMTYA